MTEFEKELYEVINKHVPVGCPMETKIKANKVLIKVFGKWSTNFNKATGITKK